MCQLCLGSSAAGYVCEDLRWGEVEWSYLFKDYPNAYSRLEPDLSAEVTKVNKVSVLPLYNPNNHYNEGSQIKTTHRI